jgi:hypothetical protein
MALATPLGSLAAFVEPSAEVAVPAIAVLAGIAGAWLQAAHPPAAAHVHDPALVALLIV